MAPILGMDRVLSDYMATTDTPQDRKELELGGNILMFFSGFAHDPQAASVVARIPRITASLIWELCAGFVASAIETMRSAGDAAATASVGASVAAMVLYPPVLSHACDPPSMVSRARCVRFTVDLPLASSAGRRASNPVPLM
jgi:hypothetical protein